MALIKNRKKSKASQLKIMEMSFMILALFLFFVLVALFFLSSFTYNLKKEANILYQEGTITTLGRLADTTEFNCGKHLCIDLDKVMALKSMDSYDEFWQFAGLKIKRLYPPIEGEIECSSSRSENCNTFTIKSLGSNKASDWSFVSLCRIESREGNPYKKCELGIIIGETEIK